MSAIAAEYDDVTRFDVQHRTGELLSHSRTYAVMPPRRGLGDAAAGDLLPELEVRLEAWAASYRLLARW